MVSSYQLIARNFTSKNPSWRLKRRKFRGNGTNKLKLNKLTHKRQWKLAEAHQYTALSCFKVLIYWLSLISCTRELWKIRLLKTERKEITSHSRLRDPSATLIGRKENSDSETQKSPEIETLRPIKNASEVSRSCQNFPRPAFFKVPFYNPISNQGNLLVLETVPPVGLGPFLSFLKEKRWNKYNQRHKTFSEL